METRSGKRLAGESPPRRSGKRSKHESAKSEVSTGRAGKRSRANSGVATAEASPPPAVPSPAASSVPESSPLSRSASTEGNEVSSSDPLHGLLRRLGGFGAGIDDFFSGHAGSGKYKGIISGLKPEAGEPRHVQVAALGSDTAFSLLLLGLAPKIKSSIA